MKFETLFNAFINGQNVLALYDGESETGLFIVGSKAYYPDFIGEAVSDAITELAHGYGYVNYIDRDLFNAEDESHRFYDFVDEDWVKVRDLVAEGLEVE